MVKERNPQTAQQDEEPGKRLPLRSRLWACTGLGEKTLWDLLQLLIVPLALAAIGFWFTAQQEARQREIEDRRAQVEREIEAERAEQVTLQAYLDQMGTLLLDRNLRAADEESDGTFLEGADLSDANLANVDLSNAEELWKRGTDMRGRGAGLGHADLSGANLTGADLSGANLKGANVTDEQLAECESLEGATMPDGARHP